MLDPEVGRRLRQIMADDDAHMIDHFSHLPNAPAELLVAISAMNALGRTARPSQWREGEACQRASDLWAAIVMAWRSACHRAGADLSHSPSTSGPRRSR